MVEIRIGFSSRQSVLITSRFTIVTTDGLDIIPYVATKNVCFYQSYDLVQMKMTFPISPKKSYFMKN